MVYNEKTNPSTALEKSRVVKIGSAKLFSIAVINNGGADVYLQLHDAIALPSNGAVPVFTTLLQAGGIATSLDYGILGRPFVNGIVIAASSTLATLTLIVGNDCWYDPIFT